MSTVVVTGVAGSVGSRVAARLLTRPDVDRVIGIDLVPVAEADPRLDARVIDLSARPGPRDLELERAVDGADAVLHLAWTVPDGKGSVPADAVAAAGANQRSLLRVLDVADKVGVSTVVHVSSATVYGAWADNKIPLTEDARLRPNPEFTFAVSKAEAERILAEWADGHPSVAVAVLRPAVTVGNDGRPLYQALGITHAPRLGDEGRPVQYLHVDDLASAVVLAWDRRLKGVYNVAPDAGIPEEEARALAGGVAKVSVPERLAARLASIGWHLWRKGVPAEAQAYATHPWVIAPDRLKAAGWVPEYSSEEALVATDERVHWDDLPPGRRQNLNLLLIAGGLAGVAGGAVATVAALRRRRRRLG
ncbi:MAG TPA: NAD-dependent epimerase/dehydratase family protein [Acidimicrobiales bacterium]|nr:NAD-dependent epimerase/dehydratase family protein [Acidimicrobiales bacterium]